MTTLQWQFEYLALVEREKSVVKAASSFLSALLKGCRELLIHTLGLNLIKRWKPVPTDAGLPAEGDPSMRSEASPLDEDACTPFIPGSLLWGQPEVVKHYLDNLEKENVADAALSDKAFDEWSAKLARGETADMDPLMLGEVPTEFEPKNLNWQRMLKLAGIQVRSTEDLPAEALPSYTFDPRRRGRSTPPPSASAQAPADEAQADAMPVSPLEQQHAPKRSRRPVHIVVED